MIKNNKGITILEIAIALLLGSIVISAAMSLYLTEHKEMIAQDEAADLQGSARAAAETMAKSIRLAGYNLPESVAPITTSDANPDTITITYDSSELYNVLIELNMASGSDQIHCDGHDISKLAAGNWIYVYDPTAKTGEFCLVSGVTLSPATIAHATSPLSKAYLKGSQIYKLTRMKFYVNRIDSTNSNLMTQNFGSAAETYADNISDISFKYTLANGSVVNSTTNPGDIRLVEINITARSNTPDKDLGNTYRTRNFTTRVKVRNLHSS